MLFVATRMDLGSIILSEVRQRFTLYDIIYIQKLKNNTNASINKIKTDSQIEEIKLWLPEECGKLGVLTNTNYYT